MFKHDLIVRSIRGDYTIKIDDNQMTFNDTMSINGQSFHLTEIISTLDENASR